MAHKSGSTFKQPVKWSQSALQEARDVAYANYVAEHDLAAGRAAFVQIYKKAESAVDIALRKTRDLTSLADGDLGSDRELWRTLRFFCAPPISEENLWTFLGKKFSGPLPVALEPKMAAVLLSAIDLVRFPWISHGGQPARHERRAAVMATAMLMAQAQLHTKNRGFTSHTQEAAVHAALSLADFTMDSKVKKVEDLQPGTFCGEKTIFNKKCDVPVRLRDGRLLTLECKVTNTPKNSWKRLNQETVGKSNTWREHMNDRVVTGCVLAGVFDTSCLVQAQDQGVVIFWQHDLSSLVSFVTDAT